MVSLWDESGCLRPLVFSVSGGLPLLVSFRLCLCSVPLPCSHLAFSLCRVPPVGFFLFLGARSPSEFGFASISCSSFIFGLLGSAPLLQAVGFTSFAVLFGCCACFVSSRPSSGSFSPLSWILPWAFVACFRVLPRVSCFGFSLPSPAVRQSSQLFFVGFPPLLVFSLLSSGWFSVGGSLLLLFFAPLLPAPPGSCCSCLPFCVVPFLPS